MTETFTRRSFLSAASAVLSAGRAAAVERPPNIVMIFADDLGYGDLGCYGSRIPTPNLDRMAAEGTRFTQFYSANPVCSPSRASLLTGRYPTRAGVPRVLFPDDTAGLPDTETTIAQMLKKASYRTMCVGKWHLGHLPRYLPTNRGFDEYFGIPYSNDMIPRVLLHNTEVVEQTATLETLTARYTERAVDFIRSNKDSPFFLYFAHTFPHIPLAASAKFRGKTGMGLYADVVHELDWSVGQVLNALRENGVDGSTLVMFSSDNGPWFQGSPGKLRGRKGSTLEGGVREPFIARFPKRIPAGRVSRVIGSAMDVLPTVAKLAGAKPPAGTLDGIDLWPVLSGRLQSLDRDALLYFDDIHLQCARWGRWKLHVARYTGAVYSPAPAGGRRNLPLNEPELYDLEADPDESYDVAPDHPEVVKEIEARMDRLMAGFPEPVRRDYEISMKVSTRKSTPGAFPHVADSPRSTTR